MNRFPTAPICGGSSLVRPTTLLAAAADAVARARRLATDWDPASSRSWELLELAADVERAALNLHAELGSDASLGRQPARQTSADHAQD
jgi:hypothetical protein